MGRLDFLKRTLERIVGQPDSACVVVDYSCPDGCGEWVEANHPGVRVVRVPGRKTFNRSLASNAGGEAVDSAWICFCDCDVQFDPGFASHMLPRLEPGRYYCPHPIREWGLNGTFICARADFERVGGYDAVYEGWGEDDVDLYGALEFVGVDRRSFPSSLLRHIQHSDRSRVRFHEIKERHLAQTINRIYRFAKFDLMRETGGPLTLSARENLYATVREKTEGAIVEGRSLGLVIAVPESRRILRYEIASPRNRRGSRLIGRIHRSSMAKRFYGFAKGKVLQRELLDLSWIMHDRHLPSGLRLEGPAAANVVHDRAKPPL
jgi:glycosyltransferase involved in cell wall biosynthesis